MNKKDVLNNIETLEKRIKNLEEENEYLKKENKKLKDKLKFNKTAGRKKFEFKESDIELIKLYRVQGYTIRELANIFNCSVGLMHKTITRNKLNI